MVNCHIGSNFQGKKMSQKVLKLNFCIYVFVHKATPDIIREHLNKIVQYLEHNCTTSIYGLPIIYTQHTQSVLFSFFFYFSFSSFSFTFSLTHSSMHIRNFNAHNLTSVIDIQSLGIIISRLTKV